MLRRRRPDKPEDASGYEIYWLDVDRVDAAVCGRTLVEAAATFAPYATLDLLPDPSWPTWHRIPADARAAWERLAPVARQITRPRDPHFNWNVDLRDEGSCEQVAIWSPHSINLDLYRTPARADPAALTLHDQGCSIDALLSADEAELLAAALAAVGCDVAWMHP